jgi:peptidoglycan/LPS O-acetylase OafA/YrhL
VARVADDAGLETHVGRRIDHLLLVRALACFCVIVHHTVITIDRSFWPTLAMAGPINLSWIFIGCPTSGVYLFFVLSGYLMGKGFVRGRYTSPLADSGRFYWRRFFRIVPAYLFYLLCAFTLEAPLVPSLAQFATTMMHLLTFTYPASADAEGILLHLWTISTEMQFYLLVPLFALVLLRFAPKLDVRRALALISVCLAAGVANRLLESQSNQLEIQTSLRSFIDLFLAGMLLNYVPVPPLALGYRRQIAALAAAIGIAYSVCSIAFFLQATPHAWKSQELGFVATPTVTALIALSLIWLAERINLHEHMSAREYRIVRPFEFFGTLTFSIYLWHWLFINKIWVFTNAANALGLYLERFSLMFFCTVVMATVSYIAVETPFNRLPFLFRKPTVARAA